MMTEYEKSGGEYQVKQKETATSELGDSGMIHTYERILGVQQSKVSGLLCVFQNLFPTNIMQSSFHSINLADL